MAAKEIIFSQPARQASPRAQHPGQHGEGDAGSARTQRHHREVLGLALVTKDGVTVAKEIELSDRMANMGAQMVKEVASKTSDVAGMAPPPRPCWPRPSSTRVPPGGRRLEPDGHQARD